ncbi:MAG: hypothetical protein WCS62_06170 [Bacilli bacterium]
MDTIKKEGIGAVKNVSTAAEGVRRVLKEGPGIGFKNIRDYNRTKEMIERGSVQRGSFKSMYNKATKKSYTPKDINDEKAAIAKANAKAVATARAKASVKARASAKAKTKANAEALKKASSNLGKRGSTARAAANKELDLQKLFKENKTVEAAVKKFYGKDVKVENLGKKVKPSQFNKKREKGGLYQVLRDLNMPKNKQGGILKFQNSGIIPSINKGLSLPEWLKSPIKLTYNSLKDSNADKLRFTSPTVSKGMSDFATKFPTMSKIFNTPEQSYQGSQTVQETPDELLIDDYNVLPYEAKPYRNINPLLESAKFAFVNKKNQENLALQLKAATQIPKLNTAERTHLRTSNVYSNIADRQANEVSGEGRRLAGTIADIDKALNVRLEGAKQAAGIRATGAYKDIENNQAIRDKQMGIDANTNAYNRNVMDKQSALSAEAMKNVYAIQSMGKTMEANAGQNFLLAYGRNKESEPYRKAM